jgi:hypothetical protein
MACSKLFALNELDDERISVDDNRIIVDDFYVSPDAIRRLALAQPSWGPRRFFPGLQAVVSVDTGPLFEQLRRIVDVASLSPASETAHKAVFSMITKKDAELEPRQSRNPHADGHSHLAGLVYLNLPEQCHGGTSFYRHRKTGLEHQPRDLQGLMAAMGVTTPPVDATAVDALWERFFDELFPTEPGAPQYIRESTERWELTELVEMRWNRAVFYDSNLFHSNYTRDDWFGDTPETRRLTQTLFLDVVVT